MWENGAENETNDALERCLEIVNRQSPPPYENARTDSEVMANAIVQSGNIQAAATLAAIILPSKSRQP